MYMYIHVHVHGVHMYICSTVHECTCGTAFEITCSFDDLPLRDAFSSLTNSLFILLVVVELMAEGEDEKGGRGGG